MEYCRASGHAVDLQPLLQLELDERMEPGDMVDVEVAEEKKDRLILRYVLISLRNPVTGIKDNIIIPGPDQDRDGIAGRGIEPAIGTKECHLHGYRVCTVRKKAWW